MSLNGIVVGDFGQVIKATFIDVDTDAAFDISSYATTKQMIFTDPSGTESAQTAAFDTDGTDGVISYTIASGLIDEAGIWTVRGKVINGSTAELTTEKLSFRVLEDTASAYYFVSVNGDDNNAGTKAAPLQTLSAIPILSGGEVIMLAKGSTWREELVISANGVTVVGYGPSGNRPIISAFNVAVNASFSKTAGQTNVYQISITPDWQGGGDDWLNVLEDSTFLTRASSVADCDATAGSMYPSAEGSGTITLYVHASDSSDVTANGKTYEYTQRKTALDMIASDDSMVRGIDVRGNLQTSYSMGIGNNGMVYDCFIRYCGKNGLMARQGTTISNCTSQYGYYGADTVTLFDSYDADPEDEDITYVSCTATGLQAYPVTGYGGHADPGVTYWGNLGFTSCTATDCRVGWNLKDTATASLTSCTYTGFNNANCIGVRAASDVTTSLTMTTCTWSMVTGRAITDAVGIDVNISGGTITFTAAANTGIIYSTAATQLDMQDLTTNGVDLSGDTVISFTNAGASVYARNNTYNDNWRIYFVNTIGITLDSDFNAFSEDAMRFNVGGVGYTSVAAYVAGENQDNNSSIG